MMRRSGWFERLRLWLWSQGEPVRRQVLVILMLAAGALVAAVFVWSFQMTLQIATRSAEPASGSLPSVPESLRASARDLWQFVRSAFRKPAPTGESLAPQPTARDSDLTPHKLPTAR